MLQEYGHDFSKCLTCKRPSINWECKKHPDVLLIQLPRIKYDDAKHVQLITFPRQLQKPLVPVPYELKAAISHYGFSSHAGHDKTFIYRSNEWFKCDDENLVVPVSFDRIVQASQHHSVIYDILLTFTKDTHAYGLFYDRVTEVSVLDEGVNDEEQGKTSRRPQREG